MEQTQIHSQIQGGYLLVKPEAKESAQPGITVPCAG